MSTLQALCEAAEMSFQLPVNDRHGSLRCEHSNYSNSSHVETASSLVALSTQAKFFARRVDLPPAHRGGTLFPVPFFSRDDRNTHESVYATGTRLVKVENRDQASSPLFNFPRNSVPVPSQRKPPQIISSQKAPPTKTRKRGWVKKTWEERLEELKAYKAQNGDCNVPTLSKTNPSLGHWVHDQRKQYRLYDSGKQTSMTSVRVAKLEIIGFKWALQKHTCMKSWAERYAELAKYKDVHFNTNVPIRWKKNPSLGQWVSTQRQEYGNFMAGKKSNMTRSRIDTLNSIGFMWCLRDTTKMAPRKSWGMHFKALENFKLEHGHCDVRVRSKQHPTGALGRWVEKQRSQFPLFSEGKPCKITEEQVNKLESLGFKWRVRIDKRV
eukprot:CAMPEP_0198264118 /NCGR_PEP_ID=MMETSP1447-20131203/14894_1 /TAXON_ID=420782 /ORGANISM="Chaetoceros dichaeta, Strain CCMP1751" /LENGTH=380 /DNA_ID=CAMNT_0043952965 /DNA_START=122 /DNA_END=1264 /DNA_ORIENTATION=+